jgi:hypothetical protein
LKLLYFGTTKTANKIHVHTGSRPISVALLLDLPVLKSYDVDVYRYVGMYIPTHWFGLVKILWCALAPLV